jgi:hypothetical protein
MIEVICYVDCYLPTRHEFRSHMDADRWICRMRLDHGTNIRFVINYYPSGGRPHARSGESKWERQVSE